MVSLDKYSCFCEEKGLELFTSQSEIQFIKCKRGECGFFTKAADLGEYLNTIDEKLEKTYKKKVPLCNHSMPATLYISKSEKNPGRPFFKCNQRDDACKYFQWADKYPSKSTSENWKPATAEKSTMTDPVKPPKPAKRAKKYVIAED